MSVKIHESSTYQFPSFKGIISILRAKFIFTNNNEFFRIKSFNQYLIDFARYTYKKILNFDNAIPKLTHAYNSLYYRINICLVRHQSFIFSIWRQTMQIFNIR